MPRVPYVDPSSVSDEVKQMLSSRKPLNLYRMLPHATTMAPGFLRLGRAILQEAQLPPILRELAVIRVGLLSGAHYEVHQHRRVAASVGMSPEKIDAIAHGADADVFDETEKMVLAFTDTVLRDVKAPAAQFDALLARIGERQIAELVLTIGFYMMVSRFLENFEVEIEPAGSIQ